MSDAIYFPHLHLYLHHVGKTLRIGPVTIAYYGICIAVGMLLGIWAVTRRAKETGQKPDDYVDIVIWTMLFSIIGARVYYVAFDWDAYRNDLLSVFRIREGGLAIYGGIIAGVLTLFIQSRIRKMRFRVLLDTCVIGLPIGQIVGRWGNFFNREAFGGYTDGLFAMQLPVSAVRQNEITTAMWEHLVNINGTDFIQVHPAFLYEGLWNCFVLLLLVVMRNRTKFDGELFLVYAAGYGAGRFFIESIRTDQLLIPGTQIPVSMVVSAALVIGSLILTAAGRRRKRTSG